MEAAEETLPPGGTIGPDSGEETDNVFLNL